MPEETRPDAADKAADVRGDEFFEFQTQNNANNAKRTYDVYQSFDVELFRDVRRSNERYDTLAVQAMQNAIETANLCGKQAIKHADVAADALWTDELNPMMHGAESAMAGQAPVNSQLASTASLDTVYTNLTAQMGVMTTLVTTLAQALSQSNVNISQSQAAIVAALAQIIENSKQTKA